ncbi:ArsC/Spx/MgsR family protein [Methylocapsa palsarum]|uniref:ArsC/Spx/MgsR family protein n=1 Tax=Methylocapsa palsarum TaxID=1612308 RepID=UPI000B872C02|nr:ArsC/Spx/MgsR family protein [Methylocapsa palsarum]
MATIIFYEKPGCKTNSQQKRLLENAGHIVVARNLLAQSWTPESLRPYFGDAAPASWFNASAPAVKSGAVDPAAMAPEAALAALAAHPILIRRPLLEVEGKRSAGFGGALIASLLAGFEGGLTTERCTRSTAARPCANEFSPRRGDPPTADHPEDL